MWKDIKDFEGLYQISDRGEVKSLSRSVKGPYGSVHTLKEKLLKPWDAGGYNRVTLRKDGRESFVAVHRLVATAFIDNPNHLRVVNHKNGNKKDNRVENLEWCTDTENQLHSFKLGLSKPRRKVTDEEVIDILTQKFKGMRASVVYEKYRQKLARPSFYSIWEGRNYPQLYDYVKEKLK